MKLIVSTTHKCREW